MTEELESLKGQRRGGSRGGGATLWYICFKRLWTDPSRNDRCTYCFLLIYGPTSERVLDCICSWNTAVLAICLSSHVQQLRFLHCFFFICMDRTWTAVLVVSYVDTKCHPWMFSRSKQIFSSYTAGGPPLKGGVSDFTAGGCPLKGWITDFTAGGPLFLKVDSVTLMETKGFKTNQPNIPPEPESICS